MKFISLLTLLPSIVIAYSGDMTFYAPGLGACGGYNSASDMIVAVVRFPVFLQHLEMRFRGYLTP